MTMFRKVAPEEVNRKLLHGLVVILPLGIFYAPTLFELDRTAMAALVFVLLLISIIGASKDLIHQEPSFLTDLNKAQAIELAEKFNQRAIFEIKEDSLAIICTDEKNSAIVLGSFQERWITT